ncbi:MAG: hypothetical protein LBV12_09520 [Puniceicoccales bacterium]|jgi:hypothetical protein|nr:hypothetical protein [Puniceicoccales bacterium]
MSADYIITAVVIGGAVLFMGIWFWRALRGKSRCNCGNCNGKLDIRKPAK